MSTAKETRELAALGKGCLGKAADSEPVFVLRGQDRLAPLLVGMWAASAALYGCPEEKIVEAQALAQQMREWPHRKNPD
jgi:hypothetical protein